MTARLGLESTTDRLIAVTVQGRRVARARTLALLPDGSVVGGPLRGRFDPTPVHVAVSDPDNMHRLLEVPPMTAAERGEVVRREIERDTPEGEAPRASAWRLARRFEIDGVPKDELLVVLADPTRLQLALDPLAAAGAVPRLVTTGALALMTAARALSPVALDRPTALVHWGSATLTIVVVSGNALKFARVIDPPAAGLDPFDWIPVEIDRSIRHYAVVSKGERVEQVMVSIADAESSRRLFAGGELGERLRLTVTNLNALLAPLLPGPPEDELAAGAFMLAYGAALAGADAVPNLLPPALAVQQRSRTVTALAVAAALVLAALIGARALPLAAQADALRDQLAAQQAVQQREQARLAEAVNADAERVRMREVAALLTDDPLDLMPPPAPLAEIARLAPPALRLERLTMVADAEGYAVTLTGRIEQSELTDAQQTLNDFYYELRQSPLFHGVRIESSARIPPPVAAEEAAAAPAAAPLGFVFALRLRKLA